MANQPTQALRPQPVGQTTPDVTAGFVPATAILTRPAGRNTVLACELARLGWPVLECPALEIQTAWVPPNAEIPRLEDFDLVVFVSRAAVSGYLSQDPERGSWPEGVVAACMGPVTAAAIVRAYGTGLTVLHPEGAASQDSEALWPLLLAQKVLPQRVLILRGQDGREWLGEKLTNVGAAVTVHQAYQREVAPWPQQLCDALRTLALSGSQPVWLLTSTHGITALTAKLKELNLIPWFCSSVFVLTHERLKPILAKALGLDAQHLRQVLASPDDAALVLCFAQISQQLKHL